MLNLLVDIFKDIKIVSLLPIFIYLIKLFIDNINTRGVEKLLMTNSKKFFIQISNVSFLTFVFALIIGIMVISSENIPIKDAKELGIFIIVCLGYTVLIVLPLYMITVFLLNIFSFKTRYYIFLKNNKKWYISRRLNKDTLLICDEYNNYKFLKQSINDFTFYSIVQAKSDNMIKWYTRISTKKTKWISLGSIATAYVIFFAINLNYNFEFRFKVAYFIIICLLIIAAMIIILIDFNVKLLIERSSSLESKEKEENY